MHFLPLVTFPLSSVDELANQFQNCNQRVCNGDHSPENVINRLIIRFSSKTGGNHRCLLIHCLSQRLSRIVRCRVTFSGQSHQLKTGKHKKARLPVGFFCACRSAVVPFFPSFWGFSLSFFVAPNAAGRVGQQINVVTGVSQIQFFQ